ncbi:MAG TPA: hypothetical protein VFO18_00380 [Methylomirabilota bacterium]|nr:hypothetical protein [Methylomirabilota bacterium]
MLPILVASLVLLPQAPSSAQRLPVSPQSVGGSQGRGAGQASAAVGKQTAELLAALKEYRQSLERLLALQEQALASAADRREQRRDLYERGLISRREFEESERAAAAARQSVEETRRAIEAADHATVEARTAGTLATLSPLPPGGYQRTAALIRYNGPVRWSLRTDTRRLQQFFVARFGRPLPVSAFGQTPLHDRMGFDHHDALDVAVHPDSPEGRALMDYLRSAGIPFIAAWGAVPGSTSGAHIHVGQPSPRVAAHK